MNNKIDPLKPSKEFTKEEKQFIYYQLMPRKEYFEEDMIRAAEQKDLTRIKECTKAIEIIETIWKKLI